LAITLICQLVADVVSTGRGSHLPSQRECVRSIVQSVKSAAAGISVTPIASRKMSALVGSSIHGRRREIYRDMRDRD
jgi:hypothetical protein